MPVAWRMPVARPVAVGRRVPVAWRVAVGRHGPGQRGELGRPLPHEVGGQFGERLVLEEQGFRQLAEIGLEVGGQPRDQDRLDPVIL